MLSRFRILRRNRITQPRGRNGIKAAVGFVGITDVDVVWSEGQN